MHREISHADEAFHPHSQAGIYLFTFLIGLLIALDLGWGWLVRWAGSFFGLELPPLGEGVTLLGVRVTFALLAAVLGGVRILTGAFESLMAGRIGADLALAIAVVAAVLIGQPLVAAEVVFIGLFGECLEAFTFDRTQRALRRLVEICPRWCLVLRDGQEIKTRVEDVRVGEHVLIRPGKRVSVDGVVVDGRSAIDESALTGESLPVDKMPGAAVFAGTLNQHGALVIEVNRVAEHTVLGQVVEMTARALKQKAPLERTADRLARYFLPVVLGLALATFVAYWWSRGANRAALYPATYPTLAVLVVACPCALILATPAAIIAALGRLAGTGVLVKGGAALERLAKVDAVAFDKTGTLTGGRLGLGEVIPLGVSADELLRLAGAAEQRSEHLLAQVVVRAARERLGELPATEDFQAHAGAGVTARLGDATLRVGNRRLLEDHGVELPVEALAALERLDASGQTALLVARDQEVVGILGVRDEIRPEAGAVVAEIAALGVKRLAILTGDRAAVARNVARALDVDEVRAELLPAGKAEWVRARKQEGRLVAMVGDGINDAPALAQADVGLALGGVGADVAAEAGDFVLMGDPLKPLPLLFRLSRQTVAVIRQNILVFAFGVNVAGVVLTAWILPSWSETLLHQSPIWAAVYHQVGSLAVLLNAMRLLGFERGRDFAVIRRLQDASREADRWMARFDAHEASHWLFDHRRFLLLGSLILAAVLYLLSGFTIVRADEVGIVRRFGKALPDDLQPGLHYRWPWPWERVTRIQPERLRRIDVGFRALGAPGGALTWASPHGEGIVRQDEEALMMTGDGNLVEVQASVFYSITDPRAYAFGVARPEELLRVLAEAVLREAVAERNFLDVLVQQRAELQRELLRRLQEQSAAGHPLGIALHSVTLQDVHPPQVVVDAYYEVTKAMSHKDRLVSEAHKERESAISREEVGKRRLEALAQGEYLATTQRSQAERDAFLYLVAAQRVDWLAGFQLPPIQGQPASVAALLLTLDALEADRQLPGELTEFRLQVDAASQVLSGRPKVLRDPALKGQLHVMPELLKLRLPPNLPRDSARAPRGRDEGP